MPKAAYVREHLRLIDVLRNPTPEGLKAEAKEQAADLRKAKGG
jgi:hypothetical protein